MVNLQSKIIAHLEDRYGATYSIPNMLMESLSISKSSAYKKINCEIGLSLEEVETLRQKVRSNGHFRDFPPPADDSAT